MGSACGVHLAELQLRLVAIPVFNHIGAMQKCGKGVVCESSSGWILDSMLLLQINSDENKETYSCKEENTDCPVVYNTHQELFAIEGPYCMDSQYQKKATSHICKDSKKKRQTKCIKTFQRGKRKAELNKGEIALQNYYDQVKSIILPAYRDLLQLGKECTYFNKSQVQDHGNNAIARQAASQLTSGDDTALSEYCTSTKDAPVPGIILLTQTNKCQELPINTLVCNERTSVTILEKDGHRYVIPPRASFLCSDISHVKNLMFGSCLYDVIVLDPPWQNKSVKRQKMYNSLCNDDLVEQLPLGDLMAPGCIVVVWVTNKQAQQAFVKNTLFPAFNITFCTQWYWLKVTRQGEPVCDLDSQHKKPFESVVIGCYNGDSNTIPCEQVLISVPCVLHSRKPPLHDILEKVHPKKQPRCLELFARNLLPGWTSWGNEVVKFQEEKYFVSHGLGSVSPS